jgi:hypothetical protein
MRRPVDNKTLQLLLRNPAAMARHHATGRTPALANPSSPLITLLKSLSPRDRSLITGLTIDASMGYSGSRIFATAGQAMNWLVPPHAATHYPSESWQDKRFQKALTIDELAKNANVPHDIVEHWWQRHPSLGRRSSDPLPPGDECPDIAGYGKAQQQTQLR